MSEGSIQSTGSTPAEPTQVVQGTSSAPATFSGEATSATNIQNMADLRSKAPEVHDEMMKGIAMSIIRQLNRRNERIKKMWRESRYE
ncbi:MAG: hypothetical protein WD595_00770 [Waddliaceae bacterium]